MAKSMHTAIHTPYMFRLKSLFRRIARVRRKHQIPIKVVIVTYSISPAPLREEEITDTRHRNGRESDNILIAKFPIFKISRSDEYIDTNCLEKLKLKLPKIHMRIRLIFSIL